MSLFYVTIDTGDGYYGHNETWPAELTAAEKTLLARELSALKKIGAVESFGIKPLASIKSLSALRPKIQGWLKANPTGRTYGGPGAGR